MPTRSIFFDEWQKCLHAHYLHVLRERDAITEPTLRRVLLNTGLTEAELAEMQQHAAGPVHESAGLPEAVFSDLAADDPAGDVGDDPGSGEARADGDPPVSPEPPAAGQLSLF